MSPQDTSNCSHEANHIKEFPSQEFASQQHSAVAPLKSEEVKTEILECDQEEGCQNRESEPPQTTRFVEEIERVDSTGVIDSGKDHSSAALAVSNFQSIDTTDDEGDYSAAESMEKSVQPSQQEVQEILQQLREIPCTP